MSKSERLTLCTCLVPRRLLIERTLYRQFGDEAAVGSCMCGNVIADIKSLFRKRTKLRDSDCDVSCISKNIQDGGQLNISNQYI